MASGQKADPGRSTAEEATVDATAPNELDGLEPHLCFRIGTTWLALPAEQVDEIAVDVAAVPLPLAPPHIAGVFNLSGHVIPMVDLERFLELEAPNQQEQGVGGDHGFERIVVVRAQQMRVGIRCNRVRGILEFEAQQLRALQVIQGERLRELARGEVELEQEIIVLLDLPRLLEAARVHR